MKLTRAFTVLATILLIISKIYLCYYKEGRFCIRSTSYELFNQTCANLPLFFSYCQYMFAGLQIQINALDAIIPDSFIFVLDCTDRSFIYKSSDCAEAIHEIFALDKSHGIDNLFDSSEYYNSESNSHTYMIRRLSSHTFLGFFVLNKKFSEQRIKNAKELFQKIQIPS